ncbi:TPA: tail fiber domain-containing protein [Enterobacter asburiae]|nr:tail fiber domain-containing protein [Enterobacter asburiae]HDN2549510.1 tail fiber domain-containing protein [Enterobacter asburiae]
MIYTTGTIAISGNTLTGTGTNFTAAGSLIRNGCTVIALTSPPQVFQITAIGGATSLTVTPAANPAIPAGTKYSILLSDSLSVDGLAQDIAETFTMYQRYMSGFADVMNGTTDVTITINGVAVTVPGQKSLARKGANSDITSLSGLTTALSVAQGGTGSTTESGARTKLGLGDLATENSSGIRKQLFKVDPQLGSTVELNVFNPGAGVKNGSGLMFRRPASDGYVIMQYNTSGDYEVSNVIMGIDTASRNVSWDFQLSGNAVANAGSWLSNSDKDIKTNIKVIENPLKKMRMMHGYTWERLDDAPPGQGFIAQELMEVMPTAVFEGGRTELKDGTVVEKTLSVDVTGASAALHHEAILALMEQIEDLKKHVEALQPGS